MASHRFSNLMWVFVLVFGSAAAHAQPGSLTPTADLPEADERSPMAEEQPPEVGEQPPMAEERSADGTGENAGPDKGRVDAAHTAASLPNEDPEDYSYDYEVVVTTRQPRKTPFNAPVGLNVVNEERLEELMPRTTAEALREQPGVWIQRTGHLGGAPIIRGFMGNRVVYLFDGVRRNTAGLFSGPNSYLNNSDPLALRRLEIIRGPGSVLYGSDAIGGVVNVITAMPLRFELDGFRNHARASSWYETVDSGKSLAFEIGTVSKDLLVNLGGSWQDIGAVQGGGDAGKLRPSKYNQGGFNGQLAFQITDRDSLELLGQHYDRPLGRRYDRVNWKQQNNRQMLVLRYHGKRRGPFDRIKAEAYYHRQSDITDERSWDSNRLDETVGGELQVRSHTGPFALTYGAHYHQDTVEKEDPQNGTRDPKVIWDNPALFALGEYVATDRLTLEAGVRGDYFSIRSTSVPGEDSIPLGLTADDLKITRSNFAVTGGIGSILRIAEHLNWVVYAGTAFRAPNKNDYLGVGEFTFGFRVPPGNELRPERSYGAETGLRADFDFLSGSLNVFYTAITDVINSKPTTFNGSEYIDSDGDGRTGADEDTDGDDDHTSTDERVYSNTNVDSASAYGVELALSASLISHLSAYGNLTLMRGEQSDGEPLDRAIPYNGTVGVRWQHEWEVLSLRYFAELELHGAAPFDRIPSSRAESDPAFKVEPQDRNSESLLQNGELPGYVVLNARFGTRVSEHVGLTLALENLTDKRYRVKDSRIDAPGFTARVGLSFTY